MALAMRLIATMTGLVLLTAATLGLLAYRGIGTPILLDRLGTAGLGAAAGIVVLAVFSGWILARASANGATGAGSDRLDRMAADLSNRNAALIDESNKLDAVLDHVAELKMGISALESKIEVAETARRALDDDLKSSNQGLKDAQTAYSIAKREDARLAKPVSVFVSRRTQRLYVRQGFDPVLEVPVTITNPEQPLGTHVFTAMGIKDGDLSWSVVSLQSPTHGEETRRAKAGVDGRGATAAKSLDRITVPQEALDAIAEVVKPGSSFVISDEATSEYFGSGTDFTVAVR